jgi:glucose-6-phosphate 1-epimerase
VKIDGECDRVYLGAGTDVSLAAGARRFAISNNEGWRSTVVWNPGADKAATMKDLADDEWRRFVCVECGQIGDGARELQPGETSALDVSISLRSV